MNKKWPLVALLAVVIIIVWQTGGIDYLLAKTFFSPDHKQAVKEKRSGDITPSENETPSENTNDNRNLLTVGELEYNIEIHAGDMDTPWDMAPLPDGRFLVTERPGRVVLLNQGEKSMALDLEERVWAQGESGLLGIAVSPALETNSHVFLYYTYREDGKSYNKVSRFTLKEAELVDEHDILDKIPGGQFHNGGRIRFGPDGKLYITTGDAQKSSQSPDVYSLAGKILRLNEDGTLPADNPLQNNPVYAYGFRNPQGLAWHPVTKQLFATDHGPTRMDEINHILPGRNYGWPTATCSEADPRYENPVACYSDFTMAPSGLDFFPMGELSESPLYVAGLRGNMVMRIDLDAENKVISQEAMLQDWGRIRSVLHHDGALYILTNNRDGRGIPKENDDKILKVTPIVRNTQSASQ